MSWTIPPLNPLRAFEAAGRLGSFTRAANELNVSHSAISRHVRGLEARLNTRLFRARSTGVELTETGRAYFDKISPAFEAISLATEALTVPPSGVVTLTTENTVAQSWLSPRLASLKAQHPEIDLRLSISTDVMDIEAHEFDLGLRYLRHDPKQDYARLFPCLVCAFAAPGSVQMSGANLQADVYDDYNPGDSRPERSSSYIMNKQRFILPIATVMLRATVFLAVTPTP